MIDNYDSYREKMIELGGLYQDFVVDCCWNILGMAVVQYTSEIYQKQVGESKTGVEIKYDGRYAETGNLYIETGEKARPRNGSYAPSGINRSDNTWLYIIGNFDVIFIFPKNFLTALGASNKYRIVENGTKTSVAYLLPHADAEKYAAQILYPNAEIKIGKAVKDLHNAGKELSDIVKRGQDEQLDLFNKWTQ